MEVMGSFYQYIAVNNEALRFEFTEIYNPSFPKYFVEVFKVKELVSSFEMKYHLSKWDIMPPAPQWVAEIRLQLSGAIEAFRNRM